MHPCSWNEEAKRLPLDLHYCGVYAQFTVTSQTIAQHICTVFYMSGKIKIEGDPQFNNNEDTIVTGYYC